ncbi:hypothetical protein XA68_11187 [Ophiocordyceps unilateralis]|uniref:Uncharacterized protein n=1 Tax=Ophiocordyceps unilateralis TaxID=268505 RepID=A0A2A9PHA6_OPHUN|nr:hypothetical protein XA68_11187 [Ophiocordyceps unilateralis]
MSICLAACLSDKARNSLFFRPLPCQQSASFSLLPCQRTNDWHFKPVVWRNVTDGSLQESRRFLAIA